MTTLQEAARKALYALEASIDGDHPYYDDQLTAIEALRTALAQQGEQQVCAGCGIPVGDVHMSTCKSGKWPSRVSNGDTAPPAPQAQPDWLLKTTQDLANSIRRRCFPEVPQFQVLDDLVGVISQIDNMTCGMERKSAPQAQKPAAYITDTHQGPMVWTPEMYDEACTYCDDGEFPVPLYTVAPRPTSGDYALGYAEGFNDACKPAPQTQQPVAWYEYNQDLDAWFLAYGHNPKAKTRPLVFGDTAAPAPQAQPMTDPCKTCSHFKEGNLPGVRIHDETCYECRYYWGNKWEAA